MHAEPLHYAAPDAIPSPLEVRLAADRAKLTLVWSAGDIVAIAATTLRAACRCAGCTRQRHDGTFAPSLPVGIASVEAIGTHGLNIGFSDGHARGIYPWAYLRQLVDGRN